MWFYIGWTNTGMLKDGEILYEKFSCWIDKKNEKSKIIY